MNGRQERSTALDKIQIKYYSGVLNVELIEDESVAREEVAVDITYNEGIYVPHAALEPVMELIGRRAEDIWETEYVEKTETGTGTQQPEKTADRSGNMDFL